MSKNKPLPRELADAFGHLPYIRYRGGIHGEWSSACPLCGESGHDPKTGVPDRFRMFPNTSTTELSNARGWCRKCKQTIFANQSEDREIDTELIKEEQRQRKIREEQERIEQEKKLETFKQTAIWEYYHDQMKEPQRVLWRKAGIPDNFQNYWRLGYTDNYSTFKLKRAEALTIPYFAYEMSPVSLQFRLLVPPDPNDKYRFLLGFHHQLWLAEPEREFKGTCLLTEGMKKGAVTFINVVAEGQNHDLMVCSVPSATAPQRLLDQLSKFDEVIVAFDPDTLRRPIMNDGQVKDPPIKRVISGLNGPVVRLASLPVKADDFFVEYDGTSEEFMKIINQARQIKPVPGYLK